MVALLIDLKWCKQGIKINLPPVFWEREKPTESLTTIVTNITPGLWKRSPLTERFNLGHQQGHMQKSFQPQHPTLGQADVK